MRTLRGFLVLAATAVSASLPAAATDTPYQVAARVPAVVDAYGLNRFDTDPVTGRIFAGSNNGLYWMDPAAAAPRWTGPVFKAPVVHVRVAADLRRVFFTTRTEAGFVDMDALDQPKAFATIRATGLVYEPSQHEIYVAPSRENKVRVFNGRTLEDVGAVTVPGWHANLADAIPGRVFFLLPDKPGLFVINASSHKAAPWPVTGKVETPGQMDVDPTGRMIFFSYDRNVVAIDPDTATVIGRITHQGVAAMAWDPVAERLLVTRPNDPAPLPIAVLTVDKTGFTEVGRLATPGVGENRLRRSRSGFLQSAGTEWLLWRIAPGT